MVPLATIGKITSACVRDSPNGTIRNYLVANGTIGNQRTPNVSRQQMVPLVPMVPLVETLVPMLPLVVPMVPLVSPTVSTVILFNILFLYSYFLSVYFSISCIC